MLTYKPEDLKLKVRHDGLDEERELIFKPISASDQREMVGLVNKQKDDSTNSEMVDALFSLLSKRIGKKNSDWLSNNFDLVIITELIQHIAEKENEHRIAQKKKASATQKSSLGYQRKVTVSGKRIRKTG